MRHYKENLPFITNPARKSRIGVKTPGENRRGNLKERRNFPTVYKKSYCAWRAKVGLSSVLALTWNRISSWPNSDCGSGLAIQTGFFSLTALDWAACVHRMWPHLSLWPSLPWMNLTTSLAKLLPASFGCGPGSPFSHITGDVHQAHPSCWGNACFLFYQMLNNTNASVSLTRTKRTFLDKQLVCGYLQVITKFQMHLKCKSQWQIQVKGHL